MSRCAWVGLSACIAALTVTIPGALYAASVSPYPDAIGRVEFEGGNCTGVLIAPNQVLTAAHCMYTGAGRRAPGEVQFAAGRVYAQAAAVRSVVEIIVPAGYQYKPTPETPEALVADVALLRLDGDLGVQPLRLARGEITGAFDAIGYAAPLQEQPRKQYACTVADRDMPDGVIATTCSGIPGASGGPLVDGSDPPMVLGVVVANNRNRPLKAALPFRKLAM